MVTFGCEEEFMLVDPGSLEPVPEARDILESLRRDSSAGADGTKEFLASQVEHSSRVFSTVHEALDELTAFRERLALTAAERALAVASVGVPFQTTPYPLLTPDDRYEEVEHEFRSVVADHQVNGLHVHVQVPDREAGVRALNGVRAWVPVLLALSGNSPFWRGADTGFESWRSIILRRWVTAGCPPHFADAADYDRRLRQLVGVGGTVDVETIAWNARLSEHWPTLELRVFDAQLEARDTVLLAALARGLVEVALDDGAEALTPPPELLDASLWHAARDGITGDLVNPQTGSREPARAVVDALLERIREHLEMAGDLDFVVEGVQRMFSDGTGAERQRRAHERGSIILLGDLTELRAPAAGKDSPRPTALA